MADKTAIITSLQAGVVALWTLATEYHLVKKILKHKSLKSLAGVADDFGEQAEGGSAKLIHQILFLGGKPEIASDKVVDIYPTLSAIFESLKVKEDALCSLMNDQYAQMLAEKDADTAHDVKNILHHSEERIDWLQRQLDKISELGDVNYQTAKLS